MFNKIDSIVVDYQESYDDNKFVELYTELKQTREVLLHKLRKELPSSVSKDEIQAIYDDAIFRCAKKFDSSKKCSFVTFMSREIEDKRSMYVRAMNAEKRKSDNDAIALDAKVSPDSETSVAEMLADPLAADANDNLSCEDILTHLKTFMQSSTKNHTSGSLIAFDAVYFDTREEKHAAMRKLLGADLSTSAIHKKIKRAKLAFKEYLEKNN